MLTKRQYLPHLGILAFAVIAGSSNLAAAKANDYSSIALSDPATTKAIIAQVDQFTPLGSDVAIYDTQTDANLAISNGYLDKQQIVATNITDRTDKKTVSVQDNSSQTIKYTVADGDTLSGIGWKFGVELATLKYLNDLTNVDSLKPSQSLSIPPTGYKVSADKIAQKDRKLALASRTTTTRNTSSGRNTTVNYKAGSVSNGYPYGWCTYYVATRRSVPTSMGNAGQWLSSAKSNGMATGSAPVPGAIMVTGESWAGHVAIVESVSGDSFTVSEMNYEGWGHISSRTISDSFGAIKGFIY